MMIKAKSGIPVALCKYSLRVHTDKGMFKVMDAWGFKLWSQNSYGCFRDNPAADYVKRLRK